MASCAIAVAVWHISTLNSLALVTGGYANSRFIVPRSVLLSRQHLLGAVMAGLAVLAVALSDRIGLLALGFTVAACLLAADTAFIYLALRNASRK